MPRGHPDDQEPSAYPTKYTRPIVMADDFEVHPIVGYTKLADVSLAANATSITILNLDLNAWGGFDIIILWRRIISVGATRTDLYVNNDLVAANYRVRYRGDIVMWGGNGPQIAAMALDIANQQFGFSTVKMKRNPWGYINYVHSGGTDMLPGGPGIKTEGSIMTVPTHANVTRLDFVESLANGLVAGSRMIVYGWGPE